MESIEPVPVSRAPVDNGDGTATVPLTQGRAAIIDAEDIPLVARHLWYLSDGTYAKSYTGGLLHRLLLDPPAGAHVDHIDGDGLNNRRRNIRVATVAENQQNQRRRKDNTSGYKGVHFQAGRWHARIRNGGERIYLGRFDTPQDAARAYDDAARELHGPYARLNFPA